MKRLVSITVLWAILSPSVAVAISPPSQVSLPATSIDGNYTISWNSVAGATSYALYETAASAPGWNLIQFSASLSRSFTLKAPDTYSYIVAACDATTCSGFSETHHIKVGIDPPAIVGPSESTADFILSWDAVPNATSYPVYEKFNGTWTLIRMNAELYFAFTNMPTGTHEFSVGACTAVNCAASTSPVHVVNASPIVHAVTSGDYNYDGLIDIAVIALDPSRRLMGDFILRNVGGGSFAVVTNPTSSDLDTARNWPMSQAVAEVGDLTLDGKMDVIVKGLSGVVPGASTQAVWSQVSSSLDYPTISTSITSAHTAFLRETALSQGNTNYYDSAVIMNCSHTPGWYLFYGWLIDGDVVLNLDGEWETITQSGYYYYWAYIASGQCVEELDPNVVSSIEAYGFHMGWEAMGSDPNESEVRTQATDLYNIIASLFLAEIGNPNARQVLTEDDARELITQAWIYLLEVCRVLGVPECIETGSEEMAKTLGAEEFCWIMRGMGLLAQDSVSRSPWFADKVPHPPNQDFDLTLLQDQYRQGSSDIHRLNFWTSRWTDSKDPLGPLAIDVVNNAYLLGCMANLRVKAYGRRAGKVINLTSVGVALMDKHGEFTEADDSGIVGKLSGPQVADYHYIVFDGLGLPRRTFGGTPMTGKREEAAYSQFIWCPSCD